MHLAYKGGHLYHGVRTFEASHGMWTLRAEDWREIRIPRCAERFGGKEVYSSRTHSLPVC